MPNLIDRLPADRLLDVVGEHLGTGTRGGITVQPFGLWRGGTRQELAAEADRIAAFHDRPLPVSISPPMTPKS